jgi:hypothetical protein
MISLTGCICRVSLIPILFFTSFKVHKISHFYFPLQFVTSLCFFKLLCLTMKVFLQSLTNGLEM